MRKENWHVRGINQDTVDQLKEEARAANMSIGQWLDYLYNNYYEQDAVKIIRLKINAKILAKLQKKARGKEMSLAHYLNYLMEVDKNYEEKIKRLKKTLEDS